MAITLPLAVFSVGNNSSQIFDLEVHAYTMDVHKPRLMSFELAQLREAAETYTYHDAGTHGVWPRLVWERRNESPIARLDDAVEFLGKWKALRFKGGKTAFRRVCATWLRKNLTDLERLQGRVLYSIAPEDFQTVLKISSSFQDCGSLQPHMVKHSISSSPQQSCYGTKQQSGTHTNFARTWRASSHTSASDGNYYTTLHVTKPSTCYANLRDHAISIGYFEPMTMILDHLAFSPKLSARAVAALGGSSRAFSDDLS